MVRQIGRLLSQVRLSLGQRALGVAGLPAVLGEIARQVHSSLGQQVEAERYLIGELPSPFSRHPHLTITSAGSGSRIRREALHELTEELLLPRDVGRACCTVSCTVKSSANDVFFMFSFAAIDAAAAPAIAAAATASLPSLPVPATTCITTVAAPLPFVVGQEPPVQLFGERLGFRRHEPRSGFPATVPALEHCSRHFKSLRPLLVIAFVETTVESIIWWGCVAVLRAGRSHNSERRETLRAIEAPAAAAASAGGDVEAGGAVGRRHLCGGTVRVRAHQGGTRVAVEALQRREVATDITVQHRGLRRQRRRASVEG